jgi:hypothetical protein
MREAASKRIAPLLMALFSAFANFWKGVEAHDPSVRGLRKIILRLRNHLDLFAPVFGAVPKLFKRLRRMLDWGYEAVGRFKDLFDAQQVVVASRRSDGQLERVHASQVSYEELASGKLLFARTDPAGELLVGVEPHELEYPVKLLERSRREVNKWVAKVERATRGGEFQALATAALNPESNLPKGRQSRFFWGGVNVEPEPDASALANARKLTGALLEEARQELKSVRALESIVGHDEEAEFHDLRKRLRAIWSIVSEFPEMGLDRGRTAYVSARLFTVVSEMGDLETMVVGERLATQLGKKARAQTLARDADRRWSRVRERELASIDRALASFARDLSRAG